MKNSKKNYLKYSIPRLVLSCIAVLAVMQVYAQESLSVIANQEGAPTELSFKELKSVFLGEKQRWDTGNKVMIALMKTNTKLGLTVCNKVYGMKPDQMNKYWLALVFQGRVSAPYYFNSPTDLQNFVAQNPGAVGILDERVENSDIKTVSVDGKKSI
ncbi:hypothetical protein [Persicitalea jodogahamensis]|uniref:Uncharacterized protein n=1 Tax=Persicitalea jodogahamensis TaxID=402147 RepID=A0A8J3G8M1_9BACT|nr:hypothetical protein [Persicitalea jodogahamensis]GHB67646.1 hypothetical protein GCM10007390_21190 [Persicitalea jodogahamensis]